MMPGLRPIKTSVRFGRRVSVSLETIVVRGLGDAEVDDFFLLLVVLRLEAGLSTSPMGLSGGSGSEVCFSWDTCDLFRLIDGDGVCSGREPAFPMTACLAGELLE